MVACPFTPSVARTLVLPKPATDLSEELRFPPKTPGSVWDYTLDASVYAADAGEPITSYSATVTVGGGGSTPLAINTQFDPAGTGLLTVLLSGGASPQDCAIEFVIATANRTYEIVVWILCVNLSPNLSLGKGIAVLGSVSDPAVLEDIAALETLTTSLAGSIMAETARAEGVEGTLTTLTTNLSGSVSTLSAGLTAEAATRSAAVSTLNSEVSSLGSTAASQGTSITTLSAGLTAETAARIAGDAALAASISALAAVVSVVSYGADASGTADSTAAFNAAFAALPSGGGIISVPQGDFKLNSSIGFSSKQVAIVGAGKALTRIHVTHTGIAFDIAPSSVLQQVLVRDVTFWAENTSGQTAAAVRVTYPVQSSGYESVAVEGVAVQGYPNGGNGTAPFPQTWLRGIVLVNCWKPRLRDVNWFGPPSAAGATSSAFLEINGCFDIRVNGVAAQYGAALVVQTGYCEGLYLVNPVVINCDRVFYQTAQTGWTGYASQKTSLLGFWCGLGELNVAVGIVQAANLIDGFVDSCDITRDTGTSSAALFFDFTDVSRFHIVNCDASGGSGGADTFANFQATYNSSGCSLIGVHLENFGTAINIVGSNGTVGLIVDNVDAGGAAITDASGITAGNRIYTRGHASSTNPSGLASTRDFVWQGPDNTVLARVQSIQAAANYVKQVPAAASNPPGIHFQGADTIVPGVIQTQGGNLYLSAGGDGVSGSLCQFTNLSNSAAWPVFQNATVGNLVLLGTNAGGLALSPQTQLWIGGTVVYSSTIGGNTSNPGSGAVSQLWSNGGAVSVALSSGALPAPAYASVTVSTGVAFSSAGTITSEAQLYLAAGTQLWLGAAGGTGAVYSATIAAQTSNPGTSAANKLWNNGNVVSLSTGTTALPLPSFHPNFVASQAFGDIAGSALIFPHAAVPTPPSARSGLLQGDRWKAMGVFSAADFVAPGQSTSIGGTSYDVDCWAALQALLLYAQNMYLAAAGTGLANIINRTFFDVHLPAGNYAISQPLIVPRFVRLGGPGTIKPSPYVNPQGGTLVSGIFDGTVNASTNFLPLVVCASQSHLSDLNLYPSGFNGAYTYKTSGLVIGKNWQATAISSIGSAGTGYSVGQVYLLANPDASPFSAIFVTVTAVNGVGGITAATLLFQGAYSLPPAANMYNGAAGLQETQWAGLGVFDPAVPHALLVTTQASGIGTGGASGSGASMIPTWQTDFPGGNAYATGSVGVPSGTTAGRITIHSAVQNNYGSGTYGPTYNVQVSGLECEIDSVRGLGGRVGLWAVYCQDLRINKLNFVDTATFAWLRYFGSIECPNCVIDTCGQAFVLDQGHGAIFNFRAFFEEGNIVNPLPPCNTGYTGSTLPGAISIGYGSSTTAPVTGCRLVGTLHNMGGLPASTISAKGLTGVSASQQTALVSISNATDCTLDIQASNYSQYPASAGGPAASLLPASALYSLGVNVDPGCVLKGSLDTLLVIDGVAIQSAIVTRTSGAALPCECDVQDTYHQTRIRSRGLCTIDGSGAPTNGTGGTGAGQAGVGSQYVNTANGAIYRNTGTLASPVWTTP
jgi:hypothetical protein